MFRRKTRSRAFSFRGARRGPITRVPTRPKLWNRANFFFDTSITVANTSDNCTNSAVLLARHLNLGELSAPGRGYTDQVKWLEIGGVVFDWGIRREALYDVGTGSSLGVTQGLTLLSDRLDATGAPITAATAQWHRPQPPVAQVSASVPAATAENADFPTKIHYRKWERKPHYAVSVNAVEGDLVAPEGQYLDFRNATVNKRLKIRLAADQGLFLVGSIVTGPSYAAGGSLGWSYWAQGQIYYRVRQ